MAALTVSLRTCWQYLFVNRNAKSSVNSPSVSERSNELYNLANLCYFINAAAKQSEMDALKPGPEILPELGDLVQGNWIRTQNLIQLLVQSVLNLLRGGQEVKSPDAHCKNTRFPAIQLAVCENALKLLSVIFFQSKTFSFTWRIKEDENICVCYICSEPSGRWTVKSSPE